MDADFWLKRWQEGATGFHMTRVTPLLAKFWPQLGVPAGSRVLVPLCGKSLDMVWLASQGHDVLGVELSPLAVEQFFTEQNLEPAVHESPLGKHYVAGRIEILCGDIFQLDEVTLAACQGAYDRGALVALPPSMRAKYIDHVYGKLADDYRGLLLTLEYNQYAMEGPPFSVEAAEIKQHFAPHSSATQLARMDILEKEPKFAERGLKSLDSVTWRLERRAVGAARNG